MIGLISMGINLTWKILLTLLGFAIIKALIKNGRDTINTLVETIAMAIRTGTLKLQEWLFTKYKETEQTGNKES